LGAPGVSVFRRFYLPCFLHSQSILLLRTSALA
jgi:hypothetical protein